MALTLLHTGILVAYIHGESLAEAEGKNKTVVERLL
jgi:hypothetical protein